MRATQRLLSSRYVWPRINMDVRQWTRGCIPCQRFKVQTHTISPTGTFLPPDALFEHVQVDLVGPLLSLKATPTYLHAWIASPVGLRPFPSPTSPQKQSPKPSCLGGFPVLEYLPPLHLTNLSLVCCLNSWLSWASTAQTQKLTIPVLMDCVVTGSMEHVTYNI